MWGCLDCDSLKSNCIYSYLNLTWIISYISNFISELGNILIMHTKSFHKSLESDVVRKLIFKFSDPLWLLDILWVICCFCLIGKVWCYWVILKLFGIWISRIPTDPILEPRLECLYQWTWPLHSIPYTELYCIMINHICYFVLR